MQFYFYIIPLIIFIFFLGEFFKKKFLLSETGDYHQKFSSKSNIPLLGGIFLFFSVLYFFNLNLKLFYIFGFLIFLLGIFSDLKFIKSAKLRLYFQVSTVFLFCIFIRFNFLNDTRIIILDLILEKLIFKLFVCKFLCINFN